MALTEHDLATIRQLMDERIEPFRVQRVEHEELKEGLKAVQIEVAHLARAVETLSVQVTRLTEAQARQEVRLQRLEEGQAELRAEVARIWKAIEETNRRMDEGFAAQREESARIWKAIEEQGRRFDARLEAMDRRFDQRLEAMDRRFDQRLADIDERFAEQGKRMEAGFAELRKAIGGLTEQYGVDLEEIGQDTISHYLTHAEGYEVGELEPAHLEAGGESFEVDLLGEARRDGQTWLVLGEVKSRMNVGEVRALVERNRRLAAALDRPTLAVLFPRRIYRPALELARAEGLLVIPWDYPYRTGRGAGAA